MNTHQIAAEAAMQAFIDHESYIQKRDVWHMPPQLPLTEELLTDIIQAAIEKAKLEWEADVKSALEMKATLDKSRAAHASEREHAADPRFNTSAHSREAAMAELAELRDCPQCKGSGSGEDCGSCGGTGAAHASERCWTEGGTADCLIHPKTDEADWAEDYDLTSFLHGDKTHAELIEANNNLFKIARKYCLENKSLRAEIKEKTK